MQSAICNLRFVILLLAASHLAHAAETTPTGTNSALGPQHSALVVIGIAPGQSVKGDVTLTCDPGKQYRDGVQYLLNGRPISPVIAVPPYKWIWPSLSVYDGPNTLVARSRKWDEGHFAYAGDYAYSEPIDFQVQNGDATIAQLSPDPTKPVSGTIQWTVQATRTMPQSEIDEDIKAHRDVKPFEALVFSIDGVLQVVRFGSPTGTLAVDTTRFLNGPHQLLVTAYAFKVGIPPVAMVMKTVDFENGKTLMDVRPDFREWYLAPGSAFKIKPRAFYTDGSVEPYVPATPDATVQFTSSDPAIATVNGNGILNAPRTGVATITLETPPLRTRSVSDGLADRASNIVTGKAPTNPLAPYKSTMRVIVGPPHGFPHFSRDGHVLTEYDPARSVFVRSLFFLGADEANRLPGLDDAIHAAGVNALTSGFYFNPSDGGHAPNFESWRRGWEPWFDRTTQFAKNHDYLLLLTGDDICRTTNELHESITNPYAPQAIQYAFTKARDSKRVVGIEMIDEASGAWGGTPRPTDGAWSKRVPPIPDDAFIKLLATIDAVPDRPLITWPVLGIASPSVAHNWMGDPSVADYASHYWDILDWRRVYPSGASIPQTIKAMNSAVVDRYPVLQRDRPFFLLTSVTGPYYHKKGAGTEFAYGQDDYIQGGPTPEQVTAMNMYGAIMGMAGLRAYGFDWSGWKNARKNDPPGSEEQTGADPFETGTDRWQALSASYNLIGQLEPYLLQPQIEAEDLGAQFVTGARRGKNGTIFMALNASELPAHLNNVDLSPYAFPGCHVAYYKICGATVSTHGLPIALDGPMNFAPGETIIWLFTPRDVGQLTYFASPVPNTVVSGAMQAIVLAPYQHRNVVRVEFYADGKLIATQPPYPQFAASHGAPDVYDFIWDTSTTRPGAWHGLLARTYDKEGNYSEARTMVQIAP